MGDEDEEPAPADADSDDQMPPYDEETQKLIEGSWNTPSWRSRRLKGHITLSRLTYFHLRIWALFKFSLNCNQSRITLAEKINFVSSQCSIYISLFMPTYVTAWYQVVYFSVADKARAEFNEVDKKFKDIETELR